MPHQTIRQVRRAFRFPVLGRLWPFLAAVAAYSALVVVFGEGWFGERGIPRDRSDEALVVGIVFGWLMSFRTHTSYARWWEGRGLWGQLVNETRNLVLKAAAAVDDPAGRAKFGGLLARFAAALRDHLRRPKGDPGPHVPMAVAGEVFALVRGWHAAGRIDGFAFLALDEHARQLMNVCGACEKIRATPLAASYRGLLRKGIAGYMALLPWMLAADLGWLTVPVTVLVAYAVVGLELIATDIEDPFGTDGDDLPLDDIVGTIERSVAGQ